MTEMYCLNNNGRIVKKFVLRSQNKDSIISSHSKIRDEMSKVNAELIFEKEISEVSRFMILSFSDYVMMSVWESNIAKAKIKIEDIVESKVLMVKNEENDGEAKESCSKARKLLKEYSGAVLEESKIAEGEYRLVLFLQTEKK